ncbi:MAG: MFS transporter [Streptosporangiaceae bacterium]
MAGSVATSGRARTGTTYREVFAVREFRTLWLAQLLSIAGDQFARLALTVLVYDRTRSALLAAVTFAASYAPMVIGSLTLGWLADSYPRRTIMTGSDLISLALVLAMTVPGMPVAALVALLGLVSLAGAPFMSARSATNREVLGKELYQRGTAITMTTYQVGGIVGYAVGGVIVAVTGTRGALFVDAATFAASALLIRIWVVRRPAAGGAHGPRSPQLMSGIRLVFGNRVARTAVLISWLVAFVSVPEGISAPLGHALGGGPATVGLLLTVMAAGAAAGPVLYSSRLVSAAWRMRLTAVLAAAACAVLMLFAFRPSLVPALLILGGSGLASCYLVSENAAFYEAVPNEHRGKAGGVANAGMVLGQSVMMIAAGAVAIHIGAQAAIAISGAAGTTLAVMLAISWRKILPELQQ